MTWSSCLPQFAPCAPPFAWILRIMSLPPPPPLCVSPAVLTAARTRPACVPCTPPLWSCLAPLTPLSLPRPLTPTHTPLPNPEIYRVLPDLSTQPHRRLRPRAISISRDAARRKQSDSLASYTVPSRPHVGVTDEAGISGRPPARPLELQPDGNRRHSLSSLATQEPRPGVFGRSEAQGSRLLEKRASAEVSLDAHS